MPGFTPRPIHGFRTLLAILLLAAGTWARAQSPAPLHTVAAVTALDNAHAHLALPVDFEATVAYSRGYENILFVQEGDQAIFVRPPSHVSYRQGDRLRIHGKTQNSFRPIVVSDSIQVVGHVARPNPIPATFWDLVKADLDCHLVIARGRIRSADLKSPEEGGIRNAQLALVTDGGHFEVYVDSDNRAALDGLLDTEVEVTGAAAGKFDDKMQQTGAVIYVAGLEDIRILKRSAQAPSALPAVAMDRIIEAHRVSDLSTRVRVRGTITYFEPGVAVVLQAGNKSLWIETRTIDDLTIGNQAEATGFPAERDRILTLSNGAIQDTNVPGAVQPFPATWEQLAYWSTNSAVGHENDLVSISGRIVTQVREPSQDEYVLDAGGRLFSAILRHPAGSVVAPEFRLPPGSTVRVTGICTVADPSSINPGGDVPFQILLRTTGDLFMTANPPLLSPRNLIILIGFLLMVSVVAIAWGWRLERRVRRQSGAMAQLEHDRSLILEGINGTRPLSDILQQIAALVSSTLSGAACSIEISDGAAVGQSAAEVPHRRTVTEKIVGHCGATLGTLHAAFDSAAPAPSERQTLEMGARLAVLAIETHRLYADLTHRSEFDALTEVHNRFSLDRCLAEQVRQARSNAGGFGLIYIDLDDFKQINDEYGHHTGDLYLQEAARRMRHQLRPGDILARLGGDEFAVLVPTVGSRQIVEEIARRLDSCFNPPVTIDGDILFGTASIGIALYPEDGATSDALLKAADVAMYEQKKSRTPARAG
ncbi:MAG TPA: GGDEF domain-containing protein [Terracidiphilus sp.]|jgi:diguanylate cyclase (GGDEF)-like protein